MYCVFFLHIYIGGKVLYINYIRNILAIIPNNKKSNCKCIIILQSEAIVKQTKGYFEDKHCNIIADTDSTHGD